MWLTSIAVHDHAIKLTSIPLFSFQLITQHSQASSHNTTVSTSLSLHTVLLQHYQLVHDKNPTYLIVNKNIQKESHIPKHPHQ